MLAASQLRTALQRCGMAVLLVTLTACGGEVEASTKVTVGTGVPMSDLVVDAHVVASGGLRRIAAPDPSTMPRVARLEVRLGQDVTSGDVLAVLDGLLEAQLDLEVARSKLQRAELEVERVSLPAKSPALASPLVAAIGEVAAADHERATARTIAEEYRIEVRRRELDVDRLRVRAPLSGRVVALHAQPGEAVQPDKGLLELSPVAREVVAELDHKVARELVVGARAEFSADGLDEALEGSILRIEDFGTGALTKVVAIFEGNTLVKHLGTSGRLRLERNTPK